MRRILPLALALVAAAAVSFGCSDKPPEANDPTNKQQILKRNLTTDSSGAPTGGTGLQGSVTAPPPPSGN